MAKFAAALSGLKDAKAKPSPEATADTPQPTPQPAPEPTASPTEAAPRGRGRPPGKRSDPQYEPTTILMRKYIKKSVRAYLEEQGNKQTLSDLVDVLLYAWITDNTQDYVKTVKLAETLRRMKEEEG
jgi:hypothetical protein